MSDDNSIPKQVVKQLGELSEETAVEAVKAVGDIAKGVISGSQLVGDVAEISQDREQELERQDQEKLNQIRGRNVEAEIEEIRKQKKQQQEEKEKKFLEEVRQKREQERAEEARVMEVMSVSSNPAKRKKSRGSAFAQGKPKQSDMSATAEFKAGVD